jgi:hypothetical protein
MLYELLFGQTKPNSQGHRAAPSRHAPRRTSRQRAFRVEQLEDRRLLSVSPAIALGLSAAAPSYGQPETITATVSAPSGVTAPGGLGVDFTDNGKDLGTFTLTAVTPANGSATASVTIPTPAGGSNSIVADYLGDSNFAANSATTSFVVAPAPTTLTLAPTTSAVYGQPVTLTATVASAVAGTLTGNVDFQSNGHDLGTATVSLDKAGTAYQASLTTTTKWPLGLGADTVTATYGNDPNYAASSASTSQVVTAASTTTTLTSTLNPSSYDQSVTLTATVTATLPSTAAVTGTVNFYDNGTTKIGSAKVLGNGEAVLTISKLPVSTTGDPITATYEGNTDFLTSTGSLSQVVNKAATTIFLSGQTRPASYGQPLTFTAYVSAADSSSGLANFWGWLGGKAAANPTGTVDFFVDGSTTAAGTATLNRMGIATFTISTLTPGTHSITAQYVVGDANYTASALSTAVSATINKATPRVTLTAAPTSKSLTVGESVTFTATVAAPQVHNMGGSTTTLTAPTGTVNFLDGTQVLNATPIALVAGTATFTTTSLPAGHDAITVQYLDDANYATAQSRPLTENVSAATTTPNAVKTLAATSNTGSGTTTTGVFSSSVATLPAVSLGDSGAACSQALQAVLANWGNPGSTGDTLLQSNVSLSLAR